MYALGIDLGTTFTAAATWRDGHTEIASLGSRAASIPSVVLLRQDETFLTGETANRRALTEPHRVAREFKRRLGDTTPILLGGVPYSAEALMARLLRSVVDEVAAREGGPPSTICVCHPANWGPYKTDLLRQALRMANLDQPVTLSTEPEAAAVFYAHQQRIEPGAIVAVYDLGGGTFDAAVLRKTETGFEILGQPEGIERLGGIDFDAAVFNHVTKALGGKLQELDEDDPAAISAVGRLKEECTEAKEALSSDTDATIPVLLPNAATEVRITRAELEGMLRPALYDSIEALKRALRSAGVTPEQLHSVLLVGGSSRMPIIAQLVGAELGRPVAVDAHPKHAVALGAAWVASGSAEPAAAPAPTQLRATPPATPPAAEQPPAPVPAAMPVPAPVPLPAPAPVSDVPAAMRAESAPAPDESAADAHPASAAVVAEHTSSPDDSPTVLLARVPASPAPPPSPAPPGASRSVAPHARRGALVLVGGVLVAALTASGIALAARDNGDDDGRGGRNTGPSANAAQKQTGSPQTQGASAPPADEQCTDEIKQNRRWVCLTEAVFDGKQLTIGYEANFAGASPNINGGYHLHVYGGDGKTPPDRIMGTHSPTPGKWYVEDENPSLRRATGRDYTSAIGDAPKVCARIATANHELVPDANGTYQTGNCVPIKRSGTRSAGRPGPTIPEDPKKKQSDHGSGGGWTERKASSTPSAPTQTETCPPGGGTSATGCATTGSGSGERDAPGQQTSAPPTGGTQTYGDGAPDSARTGDRTADEDARRDVATAR